MVVEYGYEIDPKGNRLQQLLDKMPDMNVPDMRSVAKGARERGDTFLAQELEAEIVHRSRIEVPWVEDDGGRSKYFKGKDAGDCVTRAIAIASQRDYKEVYDALALLQYQHSAKGKKSARDGVSPKAYKRYFGWDLKWTWFPTMHVGSGCQVHLRPDELPSGRIVCRLSKHLVAVIDGVIHDTYNCSRGGTRCVYGYWKQEEVPAKLPRPVDRFDISVPGAVFYDALDSLATSMAEEIGLPEPRIQKRGRGRTFFYDCVSKEVAEDLAGYLWDRGNTLWGDTEPAERAALRAAVETAQKIRKQIRDKEKK